MNFSFDDSYSAFVTWVKTLLPIAALGLLSTIFLFSGKVDVTQSLPYAEHNVANIIREQRITRPYFAGVSNNGTEITLSAAYASPDPENNDKLNITELSIVLQSALMRTTRITAGLGALDSATQIALVSRGVHILCHARFLDHNRCFNSGSKTGYSRRRRWVSGRHSLGNHKCGENGRANDRR